jgi:hypothetical protein
MGAFFRYIANLIFGPPPVPPPPPPAPPPANSYFGFQYVPGVGAPGTLDPAALALIAPGAPGLYVGFMLANLAPGFLRWAGAGPIDPVYGQVGSPFMPLAPCAAVTNLLAQLQANPPAGENWHLAAQTELDLTGYLRYATWCLNLINQTAAGAPQLNTLINGAQRVIIAPFFGGNNAVAGANTMRNTVAQTLWGFDQNNLPLNRVAIRAAVDAQYAALGVGLPRYNQFAADLNAMPLYSTFVDEAAFVGNFLQNNYLYLGAPITGQQLMDWLSVLGDPIFEAWLLVNTVVTGVNLRRFLFLAMMIALFNNSAAGGGAGTTVGWNVLNEDMNQMGNPDWRPPAIGLAHELMHAYYNGLGTAPGYDDNNFTSTAAELQVTGIIPFNNNLVSENQIRAQWAGINAPPPDATNTNGLAIPRRTIYTPVPPGQTPTTMRQNGQLI